MAMRGNAATISSDDWTWWRVGKQAACAQQKASMDQNLLGPLWINWARAVSAWYCNGIKRA